MTWPFRGKQGQFDPARKTIYWLFAGFMITVLVLAYGYTFATYRNSLTQVPREVRAELTTLRFTSNCFAWKDELSGRTYANVIDLAAFTTENLNACYRTEEAKGYKISNFRLKLGKRELMTNNYFHKDDFTIHREVLVKEDGRMRKEQLVIYVQERI